MRSAEKQKNRTCNLNVVVFPQEGTNPYVHLLVNHLSKQGLHVKTSYFLLLSFLSTFKQQKVDVIHINWIHLLFIDRKLYRTLFNFMKFLIKLLLCKINNIKIVWTIHNLVNHEKLHPSIDRIGRIILANTADAVIYGVFQCINQITCHVNIIYIYF